MNRYILAGFLVAIAAMLGSGLDNLVNRVRNPIPSSPTAAPGVTPTSQAGRVVQPQNRATGIAPTEAFDQGRSMVRGTNIPTETIPPVEIRPQDANVIPRTTDIAPNDAFTGDLDTIRPELIQPGIPEQPGSDQDLDSIPALW
jgi:hypothetical protein